MARARELIAENRGAVEAVARQLDEKGYLNSETIRELLHAHSVRPLASMDANDGLYA
jgi:hypothetical protein